MGKTEPIKKLRLLTEEELTKVSGGTSIQTVGGTSGYDENCVTNPTQAICEMNHSCFWWNDSCITADDYSYYQLLEEEERERAFNEHSGLY